MFQPAKYQKKDPAFVFEFIKQYPFAILVLNSEELLATHIPMLPVGTPEKFRLFGHIAKSNEQYLHLKSGLEALLIFQGPHAYISSSWYKEKDISTWDYSAVHINVKLDIQSPQELATSLRNLVNHFETSQDRPLWYEEIPRETIAENIGRIEGFWCEPLNIKAIAKHHQGFDKADVQSVIQHLKKQEDPQARELGHNINKEHGTDH